METIISHHNIISKNKFGNRKGVILPEREWSFIKDPFNFYEHEGTKTS